MLKWHGLSISKIKRTKDNKNQYGLTNNNNNNNNNNDDDNNNNNNNNNNFKLTWINQKLQTKNSRSNLN